MYKNKYLKYKNKYIKLKQTMYGGNDENIITPEFYENLDIVKKSKYILGRKIYKNFPPENNTIPPVFKESTDYYLITYLESLNTEITNFIENARRKPDAFLNLRESNKTLSKDIITSEEYEKLFHYYHILYKPSECYIKISTTLKIKRISEFDLIDNYDYIKLTEEEKTLFELHHIALNKYSIFITIYIKNLEHIKSSVNKEIEEIMEKPVIQNMEYYKLDYTSQLYYEKNKKEDNYIKNMGMSVIDYVKFTKGIQYCSKILKDITNFIFGRKNEDLYLEASIISDIQIKEIDQRIIENKLKNAYIIIEIAYTYRSRAIFEYFSFVKPNKEEIEIIKNNTKNKKIIELFAGTGLWAAMLRLNGCDILPIEPENSFYYTEPMNSFIAIENSYKEPLLLKEKKEVLFLCYPYIGEDAYNSLKSFRDDTFIYIGTDDPKENGSKNFFDLLNGIENNGNIWFCNINIHLYSIYSRDDIYLKIYLKITNKIIESIKILQKKFKFLKRRNF
jgi:hypothetical protein